MFFPLGVEGMNKPSSTIQASAISGGIAALTFGFFAILAPDLYTRVPPGMEAGAAVLIGTLIGYLKKENVLK
jgi:hypothetical protein